MSESTTTAVVIEINVNVVFGNVEVVEYVEVMLAKHGVLGTYQRIAEVLQLPKSFADDLILTLGAPAMQNLMNELLKFMVAEEHGARLILDPDSFDFASVVRPVKKTRFDNPRYGLIGRPRARRSLVA